MPLKRKNNLLELSVDKIKENTAKPLMAILIKDFKMWKEC